MLKQGRVLFHNVSSVPVVNFFVCFDFDQKSGLEYDYFELNGVKT